MRVKFKNLTACLTSAGNFLNSFLLDSSTIFKRTFSEARILNGLGGFDASFSEAGILALDNDGIFNE